eukprot:3940094-Rhodomonas_salina.1
MRQQRRRVRRHSERTSKRGQVEAGMRGVLELVLARVLLEACSSSSPPSSAAAAAASSAAPRQRPGRRTPTQSTHPEREGGEGGGRRAEVHPHAQTYDHTDETKSARDTLVEQRDRERAG